MRSLISLLVVAALSCGVEVAEVHNAIAMPVAPVGAFDFGVSLSSRCETDVSGSDGCSPIRIYAGYRAYYDGYVTGYYHGYRDGYYRGYSEANYPYVRAYSTRSRAVDQGGCAFGSYPVCNGVACWRVCY